MNKGFLRISEATSLAFHAMNVLARTGATPPQSTKALADVLGVSAAHLSKVLQHLTRAGLVRSIRGPSGGFTLGRPPHEITLLRVFEAINGNAKGAPCLLHKRICEQGSCMFGGLLHEIDNQVLRHMSERKLSEFI